MIDVVIPVYNVEKYIDRCMKSILNQTYKEINIILIDDGSADNSGKICDRYAAKYNNVTVYHKTNGGLSSARNYGIDKSTAEYITFVDSDDYINKHWFENLYRAIKKYNADMVCAGATLVYDESAAGADGDMSQSVSMEVVSREEMYRRMFAQIGVDVSMWSKLFKREVFQNIRFPFGELYEDMQTIEAIMDVCQKFVVTDDKGYFYYQRLDSIMYGAMSEKRMKLVTCMEGLYHRMTEKYPEAVEAARTRCVRCCIHVYNRAIFDNDYQKEARLLRKKIKDEQKFVKTSSYFEFHEKVAVQLIAISEGIYKIFLKVYRRSK